MELLKANVSEICLRKVRRTPFAHFLRTPRILVSTPRLQAIFLSRFSCDLPGMTIGLENRFIPFTRETISLIVGLRCYVLYINIDTLKFVFAGHEDNATRNDLCTRLYEFAKAEDEVYSNNFVRMFILRICNCIFFAKSTYYIPRFCFIYVDGLSTIEEYTWRSAVYDFLIDSIPKYKGREVKAPKRMEDEGSSKGTYLDGCSFGLLVWMYELLEGTMADPTSVVSIPQMSLSLEKKAPSSPDATLKLLSQVPTRKIVPFAPSKKEKPLLIGAACRHEHEDKAIEALANHVEYLEKLVESLEKGGVVQTNSRVEELGETHGA